MHLRECTPSCPRAAIIEARQNLVQNPALDTVIAFGYAPSVPSVGSPSLCGSNKSGFAFSYYADTFVLGRDPAAPVAAPAWTHVLSRDFPTYRAQAQPAVDHATGRMFLFGGYVNAAYVPSRSEHRDTSVCSATFGSSSSTPLAVASRPSTSRTRRAPLAIGRAALHVGRWAVEEVRRRVLVCFFCC